MGAQVRFAETQVSKGQIDWDALQDFVTSDEGKRELAALRSSYLDLESKSQSKKVGLALHLLAWYCIVSCFRAFPERNLKHRPCRKLQSTGRTIKAP